MSQDSTKLEVVDDAQKETVTPPAPTQEAAAPKPEAKVEAPAKISVDEFETSTGTKEEKLGPGGRFKSVEEYDKAYDLSTKEALRLKRESDELKASLAHAISVDPEIRTRIEKAFAGAQTATVTPAPTQVPAFVMPTEQPKVDEDTKYIMAKLKQDHLDDLVKTHPEIAKEPETMKAIATTATVLAGMEGKKSQLAVYEKLHEAYAIVTARRQTEKAKVEGYAAAQSAKAGELASAPSESGPSSSTVVLTAAQAAIAKANGMAPEKYAELLNS